MTSPWRQAFASMFLHVIISVFCWFFVPMLGALTIIFRRCCASVALAFSCEYDMAQKSRKLTITVALNDTEIKQRISFYFVPLYRLTESMKWRRQHEKWTARKFISFPVCQQPSQRKFLRSSCAAFSPFSSSTTSRDRRSWVSSRNRSRSCWTRTKATDNRSPVWCSRKTIKCWLVQAPINQSGCGTWVDK